MLYGNIIQLYPFECTSVLLQTESGHFADFQDIVLDNLKNQVVQVTSGGALESLRKLVAHQAHRKLRR